MNQRTDQSNAAHASAQWRVATVPNAITLVRFILVVPIAILIVQDTAHVLAFVLLVVFGASDWIDGFLARRFSQVSRFGELFDPVSDRIGVLVIAFAFVIAGRLQLWIALIVIAVDIGLVVAYFLLRAKEPAKVSWVGKARTAVLMVGIALIGLGLLPSMDVATSIGQVVAAVGAVLHLVAGLGYVATLRRARSR